MSEFEESEDELVIMSSDTESEFGDTQYLYYEEDMEMDKKIKHRLRVFDRDPGGLSNVYQEEFLPKLMDNNYTLIKWAVLYNLLPLSATCRNAEKDPKCRSDLRFAIAEGLNDSFQLKCRNCYSKESIRKHSIFYGLKCNIRSAVRILYGWVKGIDLDLMANMLGLDTETVGTLYNRASKVVQNCMKFCPELMTFGGANTVVLIDIYPIFLQKVSPLSQRCRPILCISEIESFPQKYWLEPLEYWNSKDLVQLRKVKKKIVNIITTLVKQKSVLVLPSRSSLPFFDEMDHLKQFYPVIKYVDDLLECDHRLRSFSTILDTIWKRPVEVCEQAQFFNPNYINQYFIREFWTRAADEDAFAVLINFIGYESTRGGIDDYL